jgi:hypothetical protein
MLKGIKAKNKSNYDDIYSTIVMYGCIQNMYV